MSARVIPDPKDILVWMDIETSGLGEDDVIFEIALVLTDKEFRFVAGMMRLVYIHPDALPRMDDFVVQMHSKSGLLDEITSGEGMPLSVVEQDLLQFLIDHGIEKGTHPVYGSSVHFDRKMISRHMPDLDNWLHYRIVDVSAIKEWGRTWKPDMVAAWESSDKRLGLEKAHRTVADIENSRDELLFYTWVLTGGPRHYRDLSPRVIEAVRDFRDLPE